MPIRWTAYFPTAHRLGARRIIVLSPSFAALLEQTIRQYQNRSLEAAQVIAEMIDLTRQVRAAGQRGETLGLTEDELAFYDALGVNDSAVQVLGDETLLAIARDLVETVRRNVTIDWTVKESVRANLRRVVRRVPPLLGQARLPARQARTSHPHRNRTSRSHRQRLGGLAARPSQQRLRAHLLQSAVKLIIKTSIERMRSTRAISAWADG